MRNQDIIVKEKLTKINVALPVKMYLKFAYNNCDLVGHSLICDISSPLNPDSEPAFWNQTIIVLINFAEKVVTGRYRVGTEPEQFVMHRLILTVALCTYGTSVGGRYRYGTMIPPN